MHAESTARTSWDGTLARGSGTTSLASGAAAPLVVSWGARAERSAGSTSPEELIAAAHASCFTMALSFALANKGIEQGTLETVARVQLDQDGQGFRVSRSDLALTADVPGLDEAELRTLAEDAKANCPISKLLNAEMNLEIKAPSLAA